MVSPEPFAKATTFAPEPRARSRKDEKSWLLIGCLTEPTTRPPSLETAAVASRSRLSPKV